MSDNCFICLDNTNNKVCDRCNCYAHPKCWKQYIINNTTITANFNEGEYDNHYYEESLLCPICKKDRTTFTRLTRSKTFGLRFLKFSLDILSRFIDIDDLENLSIEEEDSIYKVLNIISKNKHLITVDPVYNNTIKVMLTDLYENNYKMANLYHYDIFGKQIIENK